LETVLQLKPALQSTLDSQDFRQTDPPLLQAKLPLQSLSLLQLVKQRLPPASQTRFSSQSFDLASQTPSPSQRKSVCTRLAQVEAWQEVSAATNAQDPLSLQTPV
jgi:hypothetical protein